MLSLFFILSCVIVHHAAQDFDPTEHDNWESLDNDICGRGVTARIIGGAQTVLGEFPWMVGIIHTKHDGKGKEFACDGAIINKWTVLTAAHCVTGLPEGHRATKIVVGEWNRDADPDCISLTCSVLQVIDTSDILIHSGFSDYKLKNDIALIRLSDAIPFTTYVKPICLPDGALMKRSFAGTQAVFAGWGVSDIKTNYSNPELLSVNVQIQANSYCKGAVVPKRRIPPSQLCVGTVYKDEHYRAACYGDFGGPLMMKIDDESGFSRAYVIGIAFPGRHACGAFVAPDVFTRVSTYMEWILDNLFENKKDFILI